MKLPLIEMRIDEANESFISAIALVELPAIESDFLAFNQDKEKYAFSTDDKMELIGAVMLPDRPIFRTSPKGNFYAVFSKETIREASQIFSKKGLLQSLNIEHNSEDPAKGSYIFQSYLTDKNLGVTAPTALGDLPDGSWICGMKITDPALWKDIKKGTVKGFSVEGLFQLLPTDLMVDGNSDIEDLELQKSIREFNTALEKVNNKDW